MTYYCFTGNSYHHGMLAIKINGWQRTSDLIL